MKNDGTASYTYDAEGNMTSSGTNTFTYDALNNRVRIDYPGYASEEFVFNPSGQHTSAYSVNHGWAWAGWMFWGASPIATYINGTTQFEHQDWLGTERARTDVSGQTAGTYASLPFGDALTTVTGNDWFPYHFAGTEQDSGSNDHAMFREYSHMHGRWMSPDPYAGSYDFTNPQSFNRYAYVLNSPVSFVDRLGLWCGAPGGRGDTPCNPGNSGGGGGSGGGYGAVEGYADAQDLYSSWVDPSFQLLGWDSQGNPLYMATTGYWQVDNGSFYGLSESFAGVDASLGTSAPSKLTSLLRKIGNYIPVPCGGGAFAYGGLNVGAVFNVQVAKWFQYDTREGGSKGTFAEGSAGEVLVGGVGQQFTPGQPVETYGFLGVGGSAGVASGNVSVFASNSGSIGLAAEGGVGGLGGGVGIYQNWDAATSCFDHHGR